MTLRRHLRTALFGFLLRLLRYRLVLVTAFRRLAVQASGYSVTLVAIAVALVLFLPAPQHRLGSSGSTLTEIFVAVAGMIGAMIALVSSLAVLPVQRAAEVFTPSIGRIYRDDFGSLLLFVCLSVFCLISFLLPVVALFGLPGAALIQIQILVLGSTFDLLRWYQRRVTTLLDPRDAIQRLNRRIRRHIDRTSKLVTRLARIQRLLLPRAERVDGLDHVFEQQVYAVNPGIHGPFNVWAQELGEIASRAASRGETHTGAVAVAALADMATAYLEVRKKNLALIPAPEALFQAFKSDADAVLVPVYEALKGVSRAAAVAHDEATCIVTVQALGGIAAYTSRLELGPARKNSAPLSYLPIGYLATCVELGLRADLDDVGLQAAESLLQTCTGAKRHVALADVHLQIIDALDNIALQFLAKAKFPFTNLVIEKQMKVLAHLVEEGHREVGNALRDVLGRIERVIPVAVAVAPRAGIENLQIPLQVPYDLICEVSLPHLVAKAATLIKADETRPWVSPYSEFLTFNETVYRHFRNLAEQVQFGSSFLLWHITRTIKEITRCYLRLVTEAPREWKKFNAELVAQIGWYLAFFWVVFSKATTVDERMAEEASDTLAWAGLAFSEAGYPEVCRMGGENIRSIFTSYYTAGGRNVYALADLWVLGWHLRRFAMASEPSVLMAQLDKCLERPKEIPTEYWEAAQEAIELRKQQLDERLTDPQRLGGFDVDSATGLLRELLVRRGAI